MIAYLRLFITACSVALSLHVDTEWGDMWNILMRESGNETPSRHKQNKTSTAYGIGQFLNSTWKETGIAKTDDEYLQMKAMYIYIHKRYGTANKALKFHRRNGWY